MANQGLIATKDLTDAEARAPSACGVGMIVNLPVGRDGTKVLLERTHQMVLDGLRVLSSFDYRSGVNPATEESDGSGILFHGLPLEFFKKQIQLGAFVGSSGEICRDTELLESRFAIGHYFLSEDPETSAAEKKLIEASAKEHGLTIAGFRSVDTAVNLSILPTRTREKKPGLWQAILLPDETILPEDLETKVQQAGLSMANRAKLAGLPLFIVSQSSESIVYKGMVRPMHLADFYLDLQDPDFKVSAVALHGRFATNRVPEWRRAQPCKITAHNGEYNSAPANAIEMLQEIKELGFDGIAPDKTMSDSMQFDADLLNQMLMKQIPLAEALVRLMPPPVSSKYSEEANALLKCVRKERAPYNGPAFVVVSANGYHIAKLDECGLRPSRWGIIEFADGTRQFHAASDDYLTAPEGGRIIKKGELKPGGMIMVTPAGEILETTAVLEQICERYHRDFLREDYFQSLYRESTLPLVMGATTEDLPLVSREPAFAGDVSDTLHRILFASGWDSETVHQTLRHMAEVGLEPTAAMGDDTNPLHTFGFQMLLAYLFHQLFAQVSAPAIDSIKERGRFTLETTLGSRPGTHMGAQQIFLKSPILGVDDLIPLENHPCVKTSVLDTSFAIPTFSEEVRTKEAAYLLEESIKALLANVDKAVSMGATVLLLSDRHTNASRALIPDLLAVAAVRKHLENNTLSRRVSLVVDSYQLSGPHQTAALLALGANAVYARGAYAKINEMYADKPLEKCENFQKALEKCLLKTMGKMGITDVANYINGKFVAALGLDLTPDGHALIERPTLATIFAGIYSPLKGYNLGHIAQAALSRHYIAHDPKEFFTLLPRSGFYMPEKQGVKHGFGPEVVNAFTDWIKAEEIRAKLWQLHTILERKGYPGFVSAPEQFTPEHGFLDPREKDKGIPRGTYPLAYLERLKASDAFRTMSQVMDAYKREHPTSLRDYLSVKPLESRAVRQMLGLPEEDDLVLESQASIRQQLFSGSMSQGALTVASHETPEQKGAHETLTAGVNAVHAMSASGEGGEDPRDLRNEVSTTSSKQIASGRFGVSAMQIMCAKEIEIKVSQGAKPGEGGELPGLKVSIRFAAQRGGLPGTPFISPPPHHDIYSIEDLEQLIHDIKAVNPNVKVGVKLVASEGIGTIAIGVAKAGADVINVASHSGGTGAAQQSSIKHAGLPGELGLAEVDKALRKTGLRDLVKLRTSGGLKTADDIILSAILGADQFELGTASMLTLGCKMQRTCNQSCQPGVATDGHLFQGSQWNTERYYANLAADVQERLQAMGVPSLQSIRGRTELVEVLDPDILERYDFSALLDRSDCLPPLTDAELEAAYARRQSKFEHAIEDDLILEMRQFFLRNPTGAFYSGLVPLTTQNRSYGARIAGEFAAHLEKYPTAKLVLESDGIAGQSLGFVLPQGMQVRHTGSVQDGCGKSMTGGVLVLKTPSQGEDYRADENTLAGNAMLYGASGGKAFVNGVAGHRFGILLKGAQVVVEGVGDLAFEYMTSGTAMVLGRIGEGLCTGASGGIVFVYNNGAPIEHSESVRAATPSERAAYETAIRSMLREHWRKTNSIKAQEISTHFDLSHFQVLIPTALDKINTLQQAIDVIKTYQLRNAPLTEGMQVWLEQKILHLLESPIGLAKERAELRALVNPAASGSLFPMLFSSKAHARMMLLLREPVVEDNFGVHLASREVACSGASSGAGEALEVGEVKRHFKTKVPVEVRLSSITGGLDELFQDALTHINLYVAELGQDASGCSGCRAQSCAGGDGVKTGCPSGKAINTINATLKRMGKLSPDGILTEAQWTLLREAFELQIEESPFIAYTGAACPAPCQDACTETIPASGPANSKRGGKLVGEHVHIKDIEYYLYHLGRSLGWFDGTKVWSETEIASVFGDEKRKRQQYDRAMQAFKPAFRPTKPWKDTGNELIIVGSGPAAMQIAFEALRDGVRVRMYEKSDKPGGLLMDGIPAHKFDKTYLEEDFARLQAMGLELYLESEVSFDAPSGEYRVKDEPIASRDNPHQFIALCVGAGAAQTFKPAVTAELDTEAERNIVPALAFLKAANDVADILKKNPEMGTTDREALILEKMGPMDPRGKKIVVVGGGDTAQDVVRWVARYFNQADEASHGLDILVRGPEVTARGIIDGYPAPSHAPTKENTLRAEEIDIIGAQTSHLVEASKISRSATGKLTIDISESAYLHFDVIHSDADLKPLFDKIPRDKRPLDPLRTQVRQIENVDMILCALGSQDSDTIPLVRETKAANAPRVFLAGDVSAAKPKIIVGAQANGKDTYQEQIRPAMAIFKKSVSYLRQHSMFREAPAAAEVSLQQRLAAQACVY